MDCGCENSSRSCERAIKTVKIAIFRLPFRGPTDEFLPLRGDPGMLASWCRPQDFKDEFGDSADVIVLPGSGQTVRDLDYLRASGGESAIRRHLARGGVVAGVCGGYQMLGEWIFDPYLKEGDRRETRGLGFLPITTVFGPTMAKMSATGRCLLPEAGNGLIKGEERRSGFSFVSGYRGKDGQELNAVDSRIWLEPKPAPSTVSYGAGQSVLWAPGDEVLDGFVTGDRRVWGSYLHLIFHNHAFCKAFFASL